MGKRCTHGGRDARMGEEMRAWGKRYVRMGEGMREYGKTIDFFQVVFRDVSSKEGGGVYREILLNRRKALNALNWSMACLILDHLRAAADDPNVPMVVIEGG